MKLTDELKAFIEARVIEQVERAMGNNTDIVISRHKSAKRLGIASATLNRYVDLGLLPPLEWRANRKGYSPETLAKAVQIMKSKPHNFLGEGRHARKGGRPPRKAQSAAASSANP